LNGQSEPASTSTPPNGQSAPTPTSTPHEGWMVDAGIYFFQIFSITLSMVTIFQKLVLLTTNSQNVAIN
jgi:hypothetical protein